jgi:hypothetical protein
LDGLRVVEFILSLVDALVRLLETVVSNDLKTRVKVEVGDVLENLSVALFEIDVFRGLTLEDIVVFAIPRVGNKIKDCVEFDFAVEANVLFGLMVELFPDDKVEFDFAVEANVLFGLTVVLVEDNLLPLLNKMIKSMFYEIGKFKYLICSF